MWQGIPTPKSVVTPHEEVSPGRRFTLQVCSPLHFFVYFCFLFQLIPKIESRVTIFNCFGINKKSNFDQGTECHQSQKQINICEYTSCKLSRAGCSESFDKREKLFVHLTEHMREEWSLGQLKVSGENTLGQIKRAASKEATQIYKTARNITKIFVPELA